jgi:hypothetical protein
MTHNEFETLSLIETTSKKTSDEEEYNHPLDISDIISICQEYNKLGWKLQNQVENILEVGVEESIKSGNVRKDSLPIVKNFLRRICDNVYFGDAVSQAQDCICLIQAYEDKHKIRYVSKSN